MGILMALLQLLRMISFAEKFTQKIPFKGKIFLEICFHLILKKYLYVEKQG